MTRASQQLGFDCAIRDSCGQSTSTEGARRRAHFQVRLKWRQAVAALLLVVVEHLSVVVMVEPWRKLCARGSVDGLKLVITPDNINKTTVYDAPLMCAVWNGQTSCVHFLLGAGADVRVAADNGYTALHWARHAGMVRLLHRAGADMHAVNENGESPLARRLADKFEDECIEAFIDCGADVSALSIPASIAVYVQARKRCGHVAMLIVGVRQLRRSRVLNGNARDVAALLARAVWSTRSYDEWKY